MWGAWNIKALIVLVSGTLWFGSFRAHDWLLPLTTYTAGIDVVFVPSGIRFFLLLIGGVWAAVGVALGSLLLSGSEFGISDVGEITAIAAYSGFAPLVALLISMRLLGISDNLSTLMPRHLPVLALGTAVGSSVFHCLLYWAFGLLPADRLISDILAMAMGDFTGILIVVVFVIGALRLYRSSK